MFQPLIEVETEPDGSINITYISKDCPWDELSTQKIRIFGINDAGKIANMIAEAVGDYVSSMEEGE